MSIPDHSGPESMDDFISGVPSTPFDEAEPFEEAKIERILARVYRLNRQEDTVSRPPRRRRFPLRGHSLTAAALLLLALALGYQFREASAGAERHRQELAARDREF